MDEREIWGVNGTQASVLAILKCFLSFVLKGF
jgi:hypothetical protein